MQSLARVSQSAKGASRPQGRQAVPRAFLHAPQQLSRKTCACGGTCPHCRGETRAAANLQPKLTVNEPGDAFEQQADRVAEQVMRMADPNPPARALAMARPDSMQRLQRRAADPHGPATAPPIVHEVLRSSGQPLDAPTRAFMEPRFGADFADVRVHTGDKAAASTRAVQALAYTVGHDVVFGGGQFAPMTKTGKGLLAHELAHVIQQSVAPGTPAVQRQPSHSGPRSINPRSLSDTELAAEYERLLRASDPVEEINFEAVDAEIQRRTAGRQQQSSPAPSTLQQQNPPLVAGHAPGGPYHPPDGTKLRCSMLDSCSMLSLKISYLKHTIESHIAWDRANPDPAYPGGRHAIEIADLTNAVGNCKIIYTTKCTNQPKSVPFLLPHAAEATEAVEAVEAVELGAEGFELSELLLLLLAL